MRQPSFMEWLRRFLVVGCIGCLPAGCRSLPAGHEMAAARVAGRNGGLEARARTELREMFPYPARMTHRAVLTAGGKEYGMDGRLELMDGERARLAVLTGMGLAAEVFLDAGGGVRAGRVGRGFSKRWVESYMARDLEALFAPCRRGPYTFGFLADGRPALSAAAGGGRAARYIFDRDGGRVEEMEIVRKGRREYHATYGEARRFPDLARPIPAFFRVDAGGYRLELTVVEARGAAR